MKRIPASSRLLPIVVVILALAGCGGASRRDAGSSGAVSITVTDQGFEPAVVHVAAGRPVKLVVTRRTDRTCAKEFVMTEYKINQPLPLNRPVEITFTPDRTGELRYACGMDMISGTIVVE